MVSVVVPVLNAEKYLRQCIESILGQSYEDIELLLFVGKCTDNSISICESYRKSDDRVSIYDQINIGPAGARNQGLDMAKGEFVFFCDADDYLQKDCIKTYVKVMTDNDADIVESDVFFVREDENGVKYEPYGSSFWSNEIGHEYVERFGSPVVWKFFSRKSLWDDNGLRFPDSLRSMDDLSMYSLLFSVAKKPVYISDRLYYYRVLPGSLSRTKEKQRNRFENMFYICEYVYDQFTRRHIYEENRLKLVSQMEHHGRLCLDSIPDVTDEEYMELAQRLSICIKEKFDVNTTIFETKVFAFGSSLIQNLAERLTIPRVNRVSYVKDSSIKDFVQSSKASENLNDSSVFLIDLLGEKYNLAGVEDLELHLNSWREDCRSFIELIQNGNENAHIVVLKNDLSLVTIKDGTPVVFDNSEELEIINELLDVYYAIIKEICPRVHLIETAPPKIRFSTTDDPGDYNQAAVAFYLSKILDYLHDN